MVAGTTAEGAATTDTAVLAMDTEDEIAQGRLQVRAFEASL